MIVMDSYWMLITAVVAPSIVSDALPSIVTAFALASVFLKTRTVPAAVEAAGSVIVKAALVASAAIK